MPLPSETMQVAQIGAQATIHAAKLGVHATLHAAEINLVAGAAILLGAYASYRSQRLDRVSRENQIATELQLRYSSLASAYVAEIRSLNKFLQENDVIGTLQASARGTPRRWYFHPGQNWLKLYASNPSLVGTFDPEMSAAIVSYYSKMLNELGRLIWLHELDEAGVTSLGEEEYKRQLGSSAKTLSGLLPQGTDLINKLEMLLGKHKTLQTARCKLFGKL